jgi:energy-coupling factor transporter transmembrane protein EcfT
MMSLRVAVTIWLVLVFSFSFVLALDEASSKEGKIDPKMMYPELNDAVRLGTGTLEEAVSYEAGGMDVFFVPLSKWESVLVKVVLEVGGEIRVSTFFLNDVRRDLNSFTVTAGNLTKWNWKNDLGVEGLYLKVEGWGQYRLDIQKERDIVELFMKEYLNLSMLLMIIVGIILAILLLSAAIYLRTISVSMTHGFEHEQGKGTKIADRSHRYDQLPFHKLADGTERMVLPRMDPCEEDLSQYDTVQALDIEQECERTRRYRNNATIIAHRPIRPKKVVIDGKEHLREYSNTPITARVRDLSNEEGGRMPDEGYFTKPLSLPPVRRPASDWS